MSDWEYDNDNDSETGSGLRAQLKKALAEKSAAEQELNKLRQERAEQSVAKFLQDKVSNPAAVARLAAKDGVELSDEKAVEKWLTDNGDLFVRPASEQSQDGDQSSDHQQASEVSSIPEGMENAMGAINRIHSASQPGLANKFEAALAGLPKNASPEEVLEAMRGL